MALKNGQGLTLKQEKFIQEFIIDGNGTRAAIEAGFSENCAAEIAYEYLRKPHIAQAIEQRRNELREESEINQSWILTQLQENAKLAKSAKQYSASTQALMGAAKILGLGSENLNLTDLRTKTEAELLELIQGSEEKQA